MAAPLILNDKLVGPYGSTHKDHFATYTTSPVQTPGWWSGSGFDGNGGILGDSGTAIKTATQYREGAYWNATTYGGGTQASEAWVEFAAMTVGYEAAIFFSPNPTGSPALSMYMLGLDWNSGTDPAIRIEKYNPTQTVLYSTTYPFTPGMRLAMVVRPGASSTVVEAWVRGPTASAWTLLQSVTDSTSPITSAGRWGIQLAGGTVVKVERFGAGDVTPPASSTPIAVSVALTLTTSVLRSVGRKPTLALTLAPTVSRRVGRNIVTPLTLTASVSRQVARSVQLALSLPVSVLRGIGRKIDVPLSLPVAVALAKQFIVSVSVPLTLAASVSRQIGRQTSVPLTLATTVSRQISRRIPLALTLTPAVSRQMTRSVNVALNLVPTISRGVTRVVSLPLTLTPSVALSRAYARIIAVALTLSPAVQRSVGRRVVVPLTLAASISRSISRSVALPLTLTPSVSREVRRSLALALILAPSVTRQVGRTIAAPLVFTVSAVRQVGRTVTAALSFAVNTTATKISGGTIFPISVSVPLALNVQVSIIKVIGGGVRRIKAQFSRFGFYG